MIRISYLGIQKPTVFRVLPSKEGVITYYFVGFGVTGTYRAFDNRILGHTLL